jgi:uncharacterized protein YxeA
MKKILLIITLILMIAGCNQISENIDNNVVENNEVNETITDMESKTTEENKKIAEDANKAFSSDLESIGQILKSGKVKNCDKLASPNLKLYCYDQVWYDLAAKSRNQAFCREIQDKTLKLECEDIVTLSETEI